MLGLGALLDITAVTSTTSSLVARTALTGNRRLIFSGTVSAGTLPDNLNTNSSPETQTITGLVRVKSPSNLQEGGEKMSFNFESFSEIGSYYGRKVWPGRTLIKMFLNRQFVGTMWAVRCEALVCV